MKDDERSHLKFERFNMGLSAVIEKLKRYYIHDLLAVVVVLCVALAVKFSPISSSDVSFFTNDSFGSVSYSTVDYSLLCVATFGIGSIATVLIWLSRQFNPKIFKALYSYLFAVALSMLMTSSIAKFILRPKFNTLEICEGQTIAECSKILTPSMLRQQFMSFPCEITSESFASALFISLLIDLAYPSGSLFVALFKAVPIFFSLTVSASKIIGQQSRPEDAIAGAFVGAFCALISFKSFKKEIKQADLQSHMRPAGTGTGAASAIPTYV